MASEAHKGTIDDRTQERVPVFHRSRATLPNGRSVPITIVNLSVGGLMARLDLPVLPGTPLALTLPVIGPVRATVRWALGGRVGCQFDAVVPAHRYYALLGTMATSA